MKIIKAFYGWHLLSYFISSLKFERIFEIVKLITMNFNNFHINKDFDEQ